MQASYRASCFSHPCPRNLVVSHPSCCWMCCGTADLYWGVWAHLGVDKGQRDGLALLPGSQPFPFPASVCRLWRDPAGESRQLLLPGFPQWICCAQTLCLEDISHPWGKGTYCPPPQSLSRAGGSKGLRALPGLLFFCIAALFLLSSLLHFLPGNLSFSTLPSPLLF